MKKNMKFEEKYEILKEYYNIHNNINIKQKELYKDFPVGKWLANFRDAYKNKKLSSEQIESLNKLNMIWENVKQQASAYLFNKKFNILKSYYEEYGNLNISTKQVYMSYPVGDYIKQFRDSYRKQGNYTPLTTEQINMLESIDIIWNPKQEKETIKEVIPIYFIKKYKNKSSKQIINNYNNIMSIINEEALLKDLKRIFKNNEISYLYKKSYNLYKNIFDVLRITEKEYKELMKKKDFGLISLIIEKYCNENLDIKLEEILNTINLINLSFYINMQTSSFIEYLKIYNVSKNDIKQVFFNYSIRCKNKIYENDSKLNNKINFLLRSGPDFNNLPKEYINEICKRNNIGEKEQLKISMLSLKYNEVLSKIKEIEENKNIIYERAS